MTPVELIKRGAWFYRSGMKGLSNSEFDSNGRRMGGYGRAMVMGILNVTPDSFSDGGRFFDPRIALDHGKRMVEEGADFLDIGAESTRPGSVPVTAENELARLLPVLEPLADLVDCPISVDTYKASVADACIKAGARVVNDVWGFQKDPDMARVCADHGVGVVLMHNRTSIDPSLDMVAEVIAFLERSIEIATQAGIAKERIALDPGIGFGKTLEQNLALVHAVDVLERLGCAVLIGVSRKSLIGKIVPSTTDERLPGTIALDSVAQMKGAEILRVHDVREAVQAARVIDQLKEMPWIRS
jgi:dihydropteroate synthase